MGARDYGICRDRAKDNTSATDLAIWPALPQAAWSDTCATLQLWMQMVGKIRMTLTPAINQCWNVTLYPTVRGLTTD